MSVKLAPKGRALVIHGGGPTAVINASLAGMVEECASHAEITSVLGAVNGAPGVLAESFWDLSAEPVGVRERIARTPGSALGSGREQLGPETFERMIAVCKKREIRYVFVNGGNGTMELAIRLSEAAEAGGHEIRVIGVPKTIDNDLEGTDHSPGYGSCARFFASALRDIGADNRALPGITVVEVLGRNAGWLAAATMLAREQADDAPHLVYLPERRLPVERFLADVERVYRRLGRVVVAICEGQLDAAGEPFGADVRTSSRKPLALNLAHVLSRRIEREMGVSARSEKPGLLGRSCSSRVSEVDRDEARACGRAAVRMAIGGATGVMVTLERVDGVRYAARTGSVALSQVAGRERLLPDAWISDDPEHGAAEFLEWARPLVGELERAARLGIRAS